MPKLYDELADWFPLLSPPAEYAEEAAYYARTLEVTSDAPVHSVLELGSGGGHITSSDTSTWCWSNHPPECVR